MSRLLCDVDGVIGDLMGIDGGGFTKWIRERGVDFDPSATENLRTHGELREQLLEFLREPDSYMRYVNPIPGAIESLERLSQHHQILFVTSITEEPKQYASKDEWIKHYFCRMKFDTLTIPSREKHYHIGDYMIDDRADTIARFLTVGERRGLFLFKQPWNFAYGEDGYWSDPHEFFKVQCILNDVYMKEPKHPFVSHTNNWKTIEHMIARDCEYRR